MKKMLLFVTIFLVIGGYIIAQNLNTDFNEKEDRGNFVKSFGKWIVQVGISTKNTIGAAIGQDWLPKTENKTNETIEVE